MLSGGLSSSMTKPQFFELDKSGGGGGGGGKRGWELRWKTGGGGGGVGVVEFQMYA